jgi:hypothetical protein
MNNFEISGIFDSFFYQSILWNIGLRAKSSVRDKDYGLRRFRIRPLACYSIRQEYTNWSISGGTTIGAGGNTELSVSRNQDGNGHGTWIFCYIPDYDDELQEDQGNYGHVLFGCPPMVNGRMNMTCDVTQTTDICCVSTASRMEVILSPYRDSYAWNDMPTTSFWSDHRSLYRRYWFANQQSYDDTLGQNVADEMFQALSGAGWGVGNNGLHGVYGLALYTLGVSWSTAYPCSLPSGDWSITANLGTYACNGPINRASWDQSSPGWYIYASCDTPPVP